MTPSDDAHRAQIAASTGPLLLTALWLGINVIAIAAWWGRG